MEDWEDAILIRQESEADECATCPHVGDVIDINKHEISRLLSEK